MRSPSVFAVAVAIACGGRDPGFGPALWGQGRRVWRPASPTARLLRSPTCPCSVTSADSGAVSGRFALELLAAVSGDGRTNALVSPLGIGVVLAMLSQGAVEPVRRSVREMLGGDRGVPGQTDGKAGASAPIEQRTGAGNSDDSDDSDGSGAGIDRGPGDSPHESAVAEGDGPAGALPCRLAAVLAAAGEDPGVKLNIANAAFADQRLDLFPSFSAVLEDRFDAQVERLDFADAGYGAPDQRLGRARDRRCHPEPGVASRARCRPGACERDALPRRVDAARSIPR